MRSVAILTLALAPGMALGACPTADDMAGGVRMVTSEGEEEVFSNRSDGMIEVRNYFEPGNGFRYKVAKGLYFLEFEDVKFDKVVQGSGIFSIFPVDPVLLPDVTPGGGWEGTVNVGFLGVFKPEKQSYQFGTPETHIVAGCTYEVIPINARYDDGVEPFEEQYFYVTELGFAYLAEHRSSVPDMDFSRSIIRIEAVE